MYINPVRLPTCTGVFLISGFMPIIIFKKNSFDGKNFSLSLCYFFLPNIIRLHFTVLKTHTGKALMCPTDDCRRRRVHIHTNDNNNYNYYYYRPGRSSFRPGLRAATIPLPAADRRARGLVCRRAAVSRARRRSHDVR